jgi:ATP/ADP translocase
LIPTGLTPTIHPTPHLPQSWWQRFKAELPTKVERKKILPLTLMFFCMLFNYTILRDTKDVLVVTAPQSGACLRV